MSRRLQLDAHEVGADVREAYGLSASGATLVRPDGFVAWRADALAADPERELSRAVGAILAR